jgi:hypothetical protein
MDLTNRGASMFDKILIASGLMSAIIGTLCACQSDEAMQPPTEPAMSLQTSPQPQSFVGTVPVPRVDERAITPTETVGAAPN